MRRPAVKGFKALLLAELLVVGVLESSPRGWFGGNPRAIRVDESMDIGRCPNGLELVELARSQAPGDSTGEECDVVSRGHVVMINMTYEESVMSGLEPVECLGDVVDEILRRFDTNAESHQVVRHLER